MDNFYDRARVYPSSFRLGRNSILCSAISPDGCWVVLSDAVSPPRIFAIREPNDKEKEDMNSDDEEEEAFFDGATDGQAQVRLARKEDRVTGGDYATGGALIVYRGRETIDHRLY